MSIKLATNGILSPRQVAVIPMTAKVIEMVELLAKEDGMNRLALHGKDVKLFYDSTWIAGVNYTDDFLMTFIKTQTMRKRSNKTLILKQMMKF